jgi:hypothetical protein
MEEQALRKEEQAVRKHEQARESRLERETIAEKRAEKAVSFEHKNLFDYFRPGINLSEVHDRDNDVFISDEAKKLESKNRPKKKPTSKDPVREKNESRKETEELNRTNDVSTISVGELEKLIEENGKDFLDHMLRCIKKVIQNKNEMSLLGYSVFSEFLPKHDAEEYSTMKPFVKNIKSFMIGFLEKTCKDEKVREDRLTSIKGIKVFYKGRNAKASKDDTSVDKKRKRDDMEETDDSVEDVAETMRDILRRILTEPVSIFVRQTIILLSL